MIHPLGDISGLPWWVFGLEGLEIKYSEEWASSGRTCTASYGRLRGVISAQTELLFFGRRRTYAATLLFIPLCQHRFQPALCPIPVLLLGIPSSTFNQTSSESEIGTTARMKEWKENRLLSLLASSAINPYLSNTLLGFFFASLFGLPFIGFLEIGTVARIWKT